jgi:hypothetical protein
MENPLNNKLLINLDVDAKICNNWYEGKWFLIEIYFN